MAVLLTGLIGTGHATASGVPAPLRRPALMVNEPAHCLLLDVSTAGDRLVAVGERGVIILSDDDGGSWRQVKAPTSVTLTSVKFPTKVSGWALGNSGIVLHTTDAGETWECSLDGTMAAKLALDAAKTNAEKSGLDDEAAQNLLATAEQLVKDGPDKPFLDLYFENETTGFIVGAYGMIFRTEDSGKTWTPWMDRVENPNGNHFYAIRGNGDNLYIAGEQGLFLHSRDKGASFKIVVTPYEGTYFTLAALPSGDIVLAGLRGNIYRTADQGETFQQAITPLPVSVGASTVLRDGAVVLANQAGVLLLSRDRGRTFQGIDAPRLPPLAAILSTGKGDGLLTVGVGGVIKVPLSTGVTTEKAGDSK